MAATLDSKKDVVRRYFNDVWNTGDTSNLDTLIDPEYTLRVLDGDTGRQETLSHGIAAVRANVASYREAFPDLQFTISHLIAEGDRVAVAWTANATHRGSFHGLPPTYKKLTYAGFSMFRVVSKRIIEELYLGDRLGLWQQLGLVPESTRLISQHMGRD
jgi:predicted ester cyclase